MRTPTDLEPIHGSGMRLRRRSALLPGALLSGALLSIAPTATLAQDAAPTIDQLRASAAAARESNDIPQAIKLYSQALQTDPTWADGWRYLGMLDYGQSAYPEARDAVTHFIDLRPQVGLGRALRGLCEFETGDYAQSLKDIQDGLALGAGSDPRNVPLLRSREALLLTRASMFEAALKSYALLPKDAAPDQDTLIAIGLAGLRVPMLPQEVADGQKDLYAAAGRAAFEFMSGNEDSAASSFEALFKRYPTAPNAHFLYGYLAQQSDPRRAIAEFKKELTITPKNLLATELLAWTLLMQGAVEQALPYAEAAGAEQPNSAVALVVLGRALVENGELREGIGDLREALQIDPANVEAHIALAEAFSLSGRDEDAWREREETLRETGRGTD